MLPGPSTCQQRSFKLHALTNSQLPPAPQTDTVDEPCAPIGAKIPVTNSDSNPTSPCIFRGTGERGPELKLFTESSILNRDSITQFVTAPPHAHRSNLGYISGEVYR